MFGRWSSVFRLHSTGFFAIMRTSTSHQPTLHVADRYRPAVRICPMSFTAGRFWFRAIIWY